MSKVLSGTLVISKWYALIVALLITFANRAGRLLGNHRHPGLQYCFERRRDHFWRSSRARVGGRDVLYAKLAMHIRPACGGTIFGHSRDVSRVLATHCVWVLPAITLPRVSVSWWASWYPARTGLAADYVVQNISATRNEREGRAAALFFNIAHYAIRSWPW